MNKLLVILGPTATGKTDLGIFLAKKFNGEIVSCDSRQVYVGLDIGSGKLPDGRWRMEDGGWKKGIGFWEIGGIKIWMYDVISPEEQYTVADYVRDVKKVMGELVQRGKLPIIVGGTGLYLKALLEGLPSLEVPVDQKLRRELQALSLEGLQNKLKLLSLKRWELMNASDRQNHRRLVRTIELTMSSPDLFGGSNYPRHVQNRIPAYAGTVDFERLKVGLTAPREILYNRIDERVISRIKQGMIEEARQLRQSGLSLKRMKQLGLEYGVLADYLCGRIKSQEELITIMQNKIHGYLRRQQTWFKKEKEVHWFDITDEHYLQKVEKFVRSWYDTA